MDELRPLTEREQLEAYLNVLYAYREYIDRKIDRAEYSLKLVKEDDE